jgi:hypothetical protein
LTKDFSLPKLLFTLPQEFPDQEKFNRKTDPSGGKCDTYSCANSKELTRFYCDRASVM